MTNFLLLVIATISVAGAVWWCATRTSAAWPPTVLAIIMLVMGVGGPIWEWSKWTGGAGLPDFLVRAAQFDESKAVQAFLWASIGAGLSALLIPRAPAWVRVNKNWMPSKNISIVAVVTTAISLAGYLIGTGPSILSREVYLQTDGIDFLLRLFWPIGVLGSLITLALLAVEKDRKVRFCMIGITTLWFIVLAAGGSRAAVALPAVGAVLIIRHEMSQRRLHLPMIAATAMLLATCLITFSVTFETRSMPHGLLNLPSVVEFTISKSLASTDSFLLPLKQLAASVFVSVPDTEMSATYGVDLDVLIANANVLPGTAQPAELERYWPYEWVPLSFAGSWFGATGWIGQFVLFGAIGWMSGYTAYNIQRSRYSILTFAPIYTAALIGVLSAQYSSRNVWRVVSIGILLCILSYLFRPAREQEIVEKIEHKEHVLNAHGIGKNNERVDSAL